MGSVRTFFVKVNKDPLFRKRFIDNPVATLENYGITLSEPTKKELKSILPVIKKHLPDLANLPKGYDALLAEVERENRGGHTDDPDMLIL